VPEREHDSDQINFYLDVVMPTIQLRVPEREHDSKEKAKKEE
jgi:hypothetical protein